MDGVTEDRGKCRIRWSENGARQSVTLPIPYSPAGVKSAAKIRAQYIKSWQRGDRTAGQAPTFGELARIRLKTSGMTPATYSSNKSILNKHWSPFFNYPIDAIQYSDLLEPFATLDLQPSSIRSILQAGSAVFQLAIKSKWTTEDPAKELKKEIKLNQHEADPFTREERDALLARLKADTGNARGHKPSGRYLFYAIRFYMGLRPSEAIALTWADYKNGTFRINKGVVAGVDMENTKTNRDRTIVVHPFIRKLLKETPRQIKDEHIITTIYGEGYRGTAQITKGFVKAMEAEGIRYRSPYNTRHTCATMMLEAGMKPAYCAEFLGHSKEIFFRIYARWTSSEETQLQAEIWASVK